MSVRWRQDHAGVGGWTARQRPVPGVHSTWLEKHGALPCDLTEAETAAYDAIATAGGVSVRRIEQERIPNDAAASALVELVGRAARLGSSPT